MAEYDFIASMVWIIGWIIIWKAIRKLLGRLKKDD